MGNELFGYESEYPFDGTMPTYQLHGATPVPRPTRLVRLKLAGLAQN